MGSSRDTEIGSHVGRLLGGRYEIERELARGGAAQVYVARELSTGRTVALKRLATDPADGRASALLEREFYTLNRLRHPSIISVLDYGVDGDTPYYTMELLDGQDMRELAPVPYRDACRYLRDVASSLALIHARRLLHRDISPRNVRLTSRGRCKLIDFGGLASFGVAREVVGTPPFIPPEALHGAPLDQRADLYSLGSLAYFMLTGQYAYRARTLQELPDAWERMPAVPSERQPAAAADQTPLPRIPAALDQLVMSLLSHNPLARPASAADVIDRLNAIAELEADQHPLTVESYLDPHALVGREEELAELRRRVEQCLQGEGRALFISGPRGSGVTRLLEEAAVHAQLGGATVLMADAELQRGAYGLMRSLLKRLLEIAPDDARRAARPHLPLLGELFPVLSGAGADDTRPSLPSANLGDRRAHIRAALRDVFVEVAGSRPLMIAVDALHRADDASAAVIASLAEDMEELPLAVVASGHDGEPAQAPAALRLLREAATTIAIHSFDADATRQFVRSLFGEASHIDRLASWMHKLSGGQPAQIVALARHLVARGVIKHADGVWLLPRELSINTVPSTIEEAAVGMLSDLSTRAVELAGLMSLYRAPMSLEMCLALAKGWQRVEVFRALDELVHEKVLKSDGDRYQFESDAVRELLETRTSHDHRADIHRRIAEFLLQRAGDDPQNQIDAGWQLLQAGDEQRGAALLADAARSLITVSDELGAAAPALEEALAVYRRRNYEPLQQLHLLLPLVVAGYYVDWRLAERYGEDAIALCKRVLGLSLADRLRPWVGRRLGACIGLATAAVRFSFKRRHGGIRGFVSMLTLYLVSLTTQAGVYALCLDPPRVARLRRLAEELDVFGTNHACHVIATFVGGLHELTRGRVIRALERFDDVLERLEHPDGVRMLVATWASALREGALYARGSLQGFVDGPGALETADRLQASGVRLFAMMAEQVRTNYHAMRGEKALAQKYQRRVEAHAIQTGSAWQAEVWAPGSLILAYNVTRDLVGVKQVRGELERLSEEIPSLDLYRRLAHAVYLFLSGRLEESLRWHMDVLDASEPVSYIGWARTCSTAAEILNLLGRHEEARQLCERSIQQLGREELRAQAMTLGLEVQRAYAQAKLGDPDTAMETLEGLIARHRDSGGPVTLGTLHAAVAELSLSQEDMLRFRYHLLGAERAYRPTGNPSLIAQVEALRIRAEAMQRESKAPADPFDVATARDDVSLEPPRSLDNPCDSLTETGGRILQVLVQHASAHEAHLYTVDKGQIHLTASIGPRLPQQLTAYLARATEELLAEQQRALPSHAELPSQDAPEGFRDYQHYVFISPDPTRGIIGVALLERRGRPQAVVPADVLEQATAELSEALDDTETVREDAG